MLIRKIEAFMRQTKMPQTRFGRLAARDPRLVDDLRKGRTPRPSTEQRVEHFMNKYWEDPMLIDLLPLPRGPRRGATERLREELQTLACGHAEFLAHSEKSWASVTFAGTRHRLELAFAGEDAVEAGELFIAFLPEHEFSISGQLVADAVVSAVDHRLDPARMQVSCELLLLEES